MKRQLTAALIAAVITAAPTAHAQTPTLQRAGDCPRGTAPVDNTQERITTCEKGWRWIYQTDKDNNCIPGSIRIKFDGPGKRLWCKYMQKEVDDWYTINSLINKAWCFYEFVPAENDSVWRCKPTTEKP
ncbi:MAG: hypothetical protein ACKOAF_05400 [Actinomycetes bacterium]